MKRDIAKFSCSCKLLFPKAAGVTWHTPQQNRQLYCVLLRKTTCVAWSKNSTSVIIGSSIYEHFNNVILKRCILAVNTATASGTKSTRAETWSNITSKTLRTYTLSSVILCSAAGGQEPIHEGSPVHLKAGKYRQTAFHKTFAKPHSKMWCLQLQERLLACSLPFLCRAM